MSDLTPEALDKLERLDREATPGPWQTRFLYRQAQAAGTLGFGLAPTPRRIG
jgi:hypothetical protein